MIKQNHIKYYKHCSTFKRITDDKNVSGQMFSKIFHMVLQDAGELPFSD